MYKVKSCQIKNALFERYVEHFNLKEDVIFKQVKAVLLSNNLETDNAHNIALLMKGIPYVGDNFVSDTLYYYTRLKGLEEPSVARLYSPLNPYTQSQANSPNNFWMGKTSSVRDRRIMAVNNPDVSIVIIGDEILVGTVPHEQLIEKYLVDNSIDPVEFRKFCVGPYEQDQENLTDHACCGRAWKNGDKVVINLAPEMFEQKDEIKDKIGYKGDTLVQTDGDFSPVRPLLSEYITEFEQKQEKKQKISYIVKIADPTGYRRPRTIPKQMETIWSDSLYKMSQEKPLLDKEGNPQYAEALAYYNRELTDRVNRLEELVDSMPIIEPAPILWW